MAAIEAIEKVAAKEGEADKSFNVSASFDDELKGQLMTTLREHKNVFAWMANEMPCVNINVTCYRMNVDPKGQANQAKDVTRGDQAS